MTSATDAVPVLTSAGDGAKSRMSTGTFFGFSMGMIGDRIFRDAPALLLLLFMTNYLAIPPALAGIAIFLPKVLIMFIDPLVGTLSDRLNTRWGRRRPPMLVGAVLASVSFVLFFHVPDFASKFVQASYMSLIILLGFTGYSLYSVPYLVMASEIASSDVERRKIMSWRVIFMAVGLTVSMFSGGFMQWLGGGLHGYAIMAWVYGAICFVSMMTTVTATANVPLSDGDKAAPSLFQQFRLVAANGRYLRLLLVGFAQKVAEGVGYVSFAYFCIYVVNQPLSGMGLVVLASSVGQVLAQPLWLRAAKIWSSPTLYTIGVLGWCLNLLLWLAMKGQSQLWLIPLGLEGGAAAGGFLMVTLSMLSNTMAADSMETGVNREGVYSGVWLAAEKMGFSMGALIVGVVISLFGFVESANGVQVAQTSTAVFGIGFVYCGINMLIYFFSILGMRRVARFETVPVQGKVT